MAAAHPLQGSIVETLTTKTHPVDTGQEHISELIRIETGRIHLKGDFRTLLKSIAATQTFEQITDLIRRQQGGSSAAEIDRGQRWTRWGGSDFPLQQGQIVADGCAARTGIATGPVPKRYNSEIAVVTAPMAEGNVEVSAAR